MLTPILFAVWWFAFSFSTANIPNTLIYYETVTAWNEYQADKLKRIQADRRNRWVLSTPFTPKYKNYVLVIGESERADYMSVYGYPLKTTPFLDSAKGVFIDGYYSSAPYTEKSLLSSLYWKPEHQDVFFGNFLQLAKKAHLKTYWISNGNSRGTANVSLLAQQSDYIDLKKIDELMYDDELLDKIQKLFSNPKNLHTEDEYHANLFILHLNGQHEPYCGKLRNQPQFNLKAGDIDCYLQSIYENDQMLQRLTEILHQQGSWSLMYFSDHGLTHRNRKIDPRLYHLPATGRARQAFWVPMLQLSSDSTEHQIIKTQKSAFNFMYAFAEWLGIKEQHLDPHYCFWCDKADENIQVLVYQKVEGISWVGGKTIPLDQLQEDPPILP
ncbi:MAG: phosphoethanolamine transferase [Neisseriaceae bacterium]|nr:phosphoethanolamine transferase [Neisseriaceae bacterium]